MAQGRVLAAAATFMFWIHQLSSRLADQSSWPGMSLIIAALASLQAQLQTRKKEDNIHKSHLQKSALCLLSTRVLNINIYFINNAKWTVNSHRKNSNRKEVVQWILWALRLWGDGQCTTLNVSAAFIKYVMLSKLTFEKHWDLRIMSGSGLNKIPELVFYEYTLMHRFQR